jgi:acylphosphatase
LSTEAIAVVLVSRRFVVGGRVQGVGFRYYTDAAAQREGLSGYVRNRHDGTVEAEVEGEADAVERFELAIRRGPPASRIDSFEVTELVPSGRVTGFRVRG